MRLHRIIDRRRGRAAVALVTPLAAGTPARIDGAGGDDAGDVRERVGSRAARSDPTVRCT